MANPAVRTRLVLALLLGAVLLPAARGAEDDNAPFVDVATSKAQDDIRDALAARDPRATPFLTEVAAFYTARNFRPLWSGSDAGAAMAVQARTALEHAYEQGLRAADYALPADGDDAGRELALTLALFRYAHDVRAGRLDPRATYKDVGLPAVAVDVGAALAGAVRQKSLDDFLPGLPPPHAEYRALVAALARYRAILAQGGWPLVPAKSEIVIGGADGRMSVLTQRLAFEDPVLAANPEPSDDDVKAAVMRFQERNGLPPDGRAGTDTLQQLNVRASVRVKQIVANLERWRWLPRAFERRYIRVNVPDQTLDYVADGDVVLRSKVVIGKKTSPTPILRTEVLAVVANPPWDIPGDIAVKQLLPHLERDPAYLASRGFTLANGPVGDPQGIKVNWRRVAAGQMHYQVLQPPGPANVLGVLMLDSPNDFDVYMHDTSNKALFAQAAREASNGCVRVEQIFPLASLALTGDAADGRDRLDDAVASGETQRLALRHPLPVYMLYWTALASPDGAVGFRPDRYGRDAVLLARLAASRAPLKAPPPGRIPAPARQDPSPGSD